MSKGFITGTNEELIKAYKESRDESYLKELIEANKGLINLLVSPYLTSIPNSELEDLTSESYIPMLRAIEDYDPEQGVAFSTLLKVYVRQHLNRLYNEATRQKRFTGTTPDSLDRLSEINKEGGTETDSTFEVECKDFSSVEFMDLLDSLQLNDKEQVAVNILMAGGAKGEIAKALDCHMVITVHDELIMEVPEDHIKEGADLLVNTMKRVGHSLIDLPMSVDAEVNDYWYGENLADEYLEEE